MAHLQFDKARNFIISSPDNLAVVRVGGTYRINSGGSQIAYPFSWGDATPANVAMVAPNKRLFTVSIVITAAFDGINASLTIGDDGDNSRLMTVDENDPLVVGEYETNPGYAYGTSTQIKLYITPGSGASQGAGFVLLDVQA
jgi:hypothetical protein